MKKVGAWSVVGASLGLMVGLGGSISGCSGDEDTVPNPVATAGGAGGASGAGGAGGVIAGAGGSTSGAGGAGTGGAGGAAGESLDPAHCTFEKPPTRATKPAAEVGAVKAGIGEARLDLPIGSPLGGYGSRVRILGGVDLDTRKDRVNVGMVPSLGTHDVPIVRAVALEVGGEKLVVVRLDSIYTIDNTVFALEKALAEDGSLRGRVIIAATHSHASYAGWQGSYILMPGGNDRPREDMFNRVVASLKEAASQALANMEPARIGVAVTSNFDPDDTVTVDRRGENNELPGPDGNDAGKRKDGQAWVLRVDRADGSPMVALADFPIHGTVTESDNLLATTDAPGAVEHATTSLMGYPVIHLQGAGGDVTPVYDNGRPRCTDDYRCLDIPSLEVIGARGARLLKPLIDGVQTGDTAAMEVVTRSFRTGRKAVVTRPDGRVLSYAPVLPEDQEPDYKLLDDDGKVAVPIDEFNTELGAGLCGEIGKKPPFPKTGLPGQSSKLGPYSACLEISRGLPLIFSLFYLKEEDYKTPGCDTIRITTSAIRLAGTPTGDYLITTVPGEPTAPLVQYIRNRSPATPERTLILGYAQDHIGYVLTAEDWLAGGYEPSINIWGPLEGEQAAEGVLEAANIAWTPEIEDPEVGSSRFTGFQYPPPYRELVATVTGDQGEVLAETPAGILWPDIVEAAPTAQDAEVPRVVGAARFVFKGGDPLVDLPNVVVERETAPGTFEPWTNERGEVASAIRGEVIISYAPIPLDADAPTSFAYSATWQPVPAGPFSLEEPARPFGVPAGKYRLHATGRAQADGGLAPYEAFSPVFSVVAAPLSPDAKLTVSGNDVTIKALLGNAPGLRALVEKGPSDKDIPLLGPWTVTVNTKKGAPSTQSVDPVGGEAKLTLDAAVIADLDSIEVRDASGNGGALKP